MNAKGIVVGIVGLLIIIGIAYYALVQVHVKAPAATTAATTAITTVLQKNSTVSVANSSSLGNFTSPGNSSSISSASNGPNTNASADQNYSTLSKGNTISYP